MPLPAAAAAAVDDDAGRGIYIESGMEIPCDA